jgi:hypothetical protein
MPAPERTDDPEDELLPDGERLPWTAIDAAIELDNLRLERQETFAKVSALARRLRRELGDVLSTVMLWESLDAVMPDRRERVQTTDQLAAEIEAIAARLEAVVAAPQDADVAEVNALRDYAVQLSKRASARRSQWHRPHHLAA